jgi:hypothetical protein
MRAGVCECVNAKVVLSEAETRIGGGGVKLVGCGTKGL